MRWTNCLYVLGVEGLAGHIPWTEADPKLRRHFRPKTYTSCRPVAAGHDSQLTGWAIHCPSEAVAGGLLRAQSGCSTLSTRRPKPDDRLPLASNFGSLLVAKTYYCR